MTKRTVKSKDSTAMALKFWGKYAAFMVGIIGLTAIGAINVPM